MNVHRLTTFERIGVLAEIEHVWEKPETAYRYRAAQSRAAQSVNSSTESGHRPLGSSAPIQGIIQGLGPPVIVWWIEAGSKEAKITWLPRRGV